MHNWNHPFREEWTTIKQYCQTPILVDNEKVIIIIKKSQEPCQFRLQAHLVQYSVLHSGPLDAFGKLTNLDRSLMVSFHCCFPGNQYLSYETYDSGAYKQPPISVAIESLMHFDSGQSLCKTISIGCYYSNWWQWTLQFDYVLCEVFPFCWSWITLHLL